MRALITGVTGFAGSHLALHLLSQGHEVWGTARVGRDADLPDPLTGRIALRHAELRSEILAPILAEARPDAVFHLAGQAHVALSWQERHATFEANVLGTVALFDAVRAQHPYPRVLLVSSGEIYGHAGSPFSEDAEARADTPYALSKTMAEAIGQSYLRWDGVPVIIARPFNHTGPRQAPTFVCSEFARAIARIVRGEDPPRIAVGNLEARRDFSDVRDIVRGYELLVTKGQPGRVYNLCSGRGVAIQEILDTLLALAHRPVEVVVDPAKLRQLDSPEIVGDGSRAAVEVGYRPSISIERALADLLRYWLESPSVAP